MEVGAISVSLTSTELTALGRTPAVRLASLGPIYENCSDSGNARRMASLYRDHARYCVAEESWYIKCTDGWRQDRDLEIWRIAKATVTRMLAEAWQHPYLIEQKEHVTWCLISESTERIAALVENAKSEMTMGNAETRGR
jgi:hypothetical protein